MPYFTITDFAAGLDLRRASLTAPAGTLRKLNNLHVTPGGEIEKRMKFQQFATADPASRGIVSMNAKLYSFRTAATASKTEPAAGDAWSLGYMNLESALSLVEVYDYDFFTKDGTTQCFVVSLQGDPWAWKYHWVEKPVTDGYVRGIYCRTYKTKIYTVYGQYLASSCVGYPDAWHDIAEDPGTPDIEARVGSTLVDMSIMDSDMNDCIAIESYYNKLAIFSKHAVQLWVLDPDPAKDQYDSTLRGAGTIAWRSVLQYGNGDVLYLATDGIRSLRARNSSLAAGVTDVGSPIDPLLQEMYRSSGEAMMANAISILQPITGRVWVILPSFDPISGAPTSHIYVLSSFPGPNINAWSRYDPGFRIVAACAHKNRIVVRDDQHKLYAYSGTSETAAEVDRYDLTPVEIEFPFHAGENPATKKLFQGLDAACTGTWKVYGAFDPLRPEAEEYLGTFKGPTFEQGTFKFHHYGTHLSLRLRSDPDNTVAEPMKLSNMIIHYQLAESG